MQLLSGYAVQQIESAPLALRMLAAAEAPPRERRRHLRTIGDTSLYVSGFWSDSLADRMVDDFVRVADDVVLEATSGDTEIDMTRAEIDGAVQVGHGEFRLRNGSVVRFLSSAVIH